jgi:hypothetical protein
MRCDANELLKLLSDNENKKISKLYTNTRDLQGTLLESRMGTNPQLYSSQLISENQDQRVS